MDDDKFNLLINKIDELTGSVDEVRNVLIGALNSSEKGGDFGALGDVINEILEAVQSK